MSKSQEKQEEPGKTSDSTKSSSDPGTKEVGDSTTEKKVETQNVPQAPASDLPLVEDTTNTDGVAAHTDICGDCCPCCCIIL